MSNGTPPARDALDNKANLLFAGKVVRKDLVRKVKVGANVPVFVLEFLLGKYCASSDEIAIQMGLQVVNDTLANNYIRPDESAKAQSNVKESGKYSFIDKVKVRLVDSDYWAEGVNFNNKFLHIPSQYVRDYERLLMGGVWAQVDMRFETDEGSKGKNPFWIDKLVPIQIATFDLDEYRNVRKQFTTDEWIDLIVRSMGYEPGEMSRRLKTPFLGPAHSPSRAKLQPRRAWSAKHRQELCHPGSVALHGAAYGGNDGRQSIRPHVRTPRRAWFRSGTSLVSTRSRTSKRCRRKSSRR